MINVLFCFSVRYNILQYSLYNSRIFSNTRYCDSEEIRRKEERSVIHYTYVYTCHTHMCMYIFIYILKSYIFVLNKHERDKGKKIRSRVIFRKAMKILYNSIIFYIITEL